MKKLKNEHGMASITMYPSVEVICPISQSSLKVEMEIEMIPSDCIPDYQELQSWIVREISKKLFTIEETAAKVCDFIDTEYCPDHISMIARVKTPGMFFPVMVKKAKSFGGSVNLSTTEDRDKLNAKAAAEAKAKAAAEAKAKDAALASAQGNSGGD